MTSVWYHLTQLQCYSFYCCTLRNVTPVPLMDLSLLSPYVFCVSLCVRITLTALEWCFKSCTCVVSIAPAFFLYLSLFGHQCCTCAIHVAPLILMHLCRFSTFVLDASVSVRFPILHPCYECCTFVLYASVSVQHLCP